MFRLASKQIRKQKDLKFGKRNILFPNYVFQQGLRYVLRDSLDLVTKSCGVLFTSRNFTRFRDDVIQFVLRSAMKTLVTDELDRTSRLCLLSNRQQQVAVRHASSNVFVDACDLSTSMSSNVIKKVATGDIVGKSTFKYGILKFAKRFDATITSALSTATTDVVIDDESKEASSFEDTETKMEVVVRHHSCTRSLSIIFLRIDVFCFVSP